MTFILDYFSARAREREKRQFENNEALARKPLDEAVLAKVPATPVEKMRATFTFETFDAPVIAETEYHHKIVTKHSLAMVLQFSEAEKEIINARHLDSYTVDEEPLYDDLQIAHIKLRAQDRMLKRPLSMSDKAWADLKKIFAEICADEIAQRRSTTLGDLIISPVFRREFHSPQAASEYAERLKKVILPKVKKLVEQNSSRPETEVVEF